MKDQVDDEYHLQSRDTERNIVAALLEIFPKTRFASRDSSAIEHFLTGNGFGNRKR